MMDKVSRHMFERLVQMDPTALTEADREWLKGRRSYMSEAQKLKFSTFLDEVSQGDSVPKPGTPQAEYRDIAGAMEAEAELHAATDTLSDDQQRAVDHAMVAEKQRQTMVKTALKAEADANKDAAKIEAERQKEADKAAKKANKAASKSNK